MKINRTVKDASKDFMKLYKEIYNLGPERVTVGVIQNLLQREYEIMHDDIKSQYDAEWVDNYIQDCKSSLETEYKKKELELLKTVVKGLKEDLDEIITFHQY